MLKIYIGCTGGLTPSVTRGLIEIGVVEAEIAKESVPVSPILFNLDPGLQVYLAVKEMLHIGSYLESNILDHKSAFADGDALV